MGPSRFEWQPYWKHLRLPFQMSLAPLFLWGATIAGVDSWPRLLLGFAAFHLFLYPGVTAYNSAYDKDEGPVGGLQRPPAPPKRLLEFSLGVQASGAVFAWFAGLNVLLVYEMFFVLGIAYSHPRVRLKRYPVASAVTVFLGQGVLGFLAGWLSARGYVGSLEYRFLLGALSASLTTLGIYPLTQIYQVDEDQRRGDRTIATVLGPASSVRFAEGCIALAGLSAMGLMMTEKAWLSATCLGIAYLLILWQVARIGSRGRSIEGDFLAVMRLNYVASGGFLLYIALRFAEVL